MISYTVGFRKVISHLQGMLGLVCTDGQSPDFALFNGEIVLLRTQENQISTPDSVISKSAIVIHI